MIYILFSLLLFSFNPEDGSDLYIMYSEYNELYKIGRSKHPKKRLKQISRYVRGDVKLIKVYPNKGFEEKNIHLAMKEKRQMFIKTNNVIAKEWFKLSFDDHCFIDSYLISKN